MPFGHGYDPSIVAADMPADKPAYARVRSAAVAALTLSTLASVRTPRAYPLPADIPIVATVNRTTVLHSTTVQSLQ